MLCFLFYNCHEDSEFLSLSNSVVTFGWESDTKEIIVDSNTHWSILADLPSWITINGLKEGNGISSIYVTVANNETGNLRKCSIVFTDYDNQKTLLISQTAKEQLYFIGGKQYQVNSSGVELLIDIEQNIDYKVYISTDARSWITQSTQSNYVGISNTNIGGRQSLILNIANNLEHEERQAKVAIYNENCVFLILYI